MRILLVLSALLGMAASAIAQDYKAPRGADGIHPDLNGIWQALGSAHYDIEMHTASHSLQLREGPHGPLPSVKTLYLGAVGAVPPGMGVVVGGKIPYTEEGLAKKLENKANWLDRDPEIKCYSRDSARHLHASTVPNIPKRRLDFYGLPVRRGRARGLYDDPAKRRWTAGWDGLPVAGRRHAGR